VVAGLAAGIAAALALGRILQGLLFGVSLADPLTLTAVALVLLAVSALACYLPALRATRTDPLAALRCE
jgi:putative ABC transport system permease protein